jgi:alpha/beta superfamily hydrolase
MPRKIETFFVNGPAGRLEARLEEPEDRDPIEAALVCHPHPQHGGTMLNKVVHRVALGLRKAGCVVLRFNYRGVNLSEGVYDHGTGEVEDARAALSLLLSRYPKLPVTLAGFSFGSRIALKLGCELKYPRRVIAVGFPTVYQTRTYLEGCGVPRVFIQSTNDEFGPLAELEAVVSALPEPKKLIAIPAGDHFFAGALEALESAVASC